MFLDVLRSAPLGAGHFLQTKPTTVPDAFERLPVNLSSDEIRAMVADLLG